MIGRSPFSSVSLRRIGFAVVAQLVERVLGKDEVTSSILVNGSRFKGQLTGGEAVERP